MLLLSVVAVLFFATTAHASVVSATGTVHSRFITSEGQWLKIERPDGSKVAALCLDSGDDAYIGYECGTANIGEPAWGEAACSGGFCTWTCIDVTTTDCNSWTFPIITGTLVQKDSCAGELYATVRQSDGSEVVAHCDGPGMEAECQSTSINQQVTAYLRFGCYVEKDWLDFQ